MSLTKAVNLPIYRRLVAHVVCALLLSAPLDIARAQSDEDRFQDFLDRLGLIDLQSANLEQRLKTMSPGDARTRLANRLADVYAQQLTESLADSDRYAELSRRVQKLLQSVPEAKTAALEVMLLQVDYQRAEALVRKWLTEPQQDGARQEAQTILQRITPLLHGQYEQLAKLVEQQLAVVDKATTNIEVAERELLRRQSIAARAAYFTGWSLYYRGLLSGADTKDFQDARGLFRRLLEFADDEKYADFDAEALSLESPWRARALVGLGMSEAALNNVSGSLECFRILNGDATALEVRDQADYWCVQALLLGGHRKAAIEFARTRIAELEGEATEGKLAFCVALIRGGASEAGVRATEAGQQLTNLGVRGLSQLRQHRVLHDLLKKYGIDVANPKGFLLLWLQGHQRLDKAQNSKSQEDFSRAVDSFRAALLDPEAKSDLASSSRCREQLAWCYYNMKQYEDATQEYRKAAEGLKSAGDTSAVEAAWMSFVSASKLVEEADGPATAMHEVANWLNKEFPGHEHSRRAMYLAGKLRMRGGSPEERLKALQSIQPNDPNFSEARKEICAVHYENWRNADESKKTEAAEPLQASLDEALSPEHLDRIPAGDQLALRLMAIDVALSLSPPNQPAAEKQLSAANRLIEASGISPESAAEYRYRALQLGKSEDFEQHVTWFLDKGRDSKFEAAALISAAKTIDAGGGEASQESKTLGLRTYRRLSELLGSDDKILSSNRNAQVALSRLAHYAYQLGERPEAAAALDKLLAVFPKDRGYLRRAGLVHFELKQFKAALDQWRTILAGTRSGTDPWYEAKYYQIACLLEVDRDAAANVFRQLKLLDPNLGPPAWRERFAELEQRL